MITTSSTLNRTQNVLIPHQVYQGTHKGTMTCADIRGKTSNGAVLFFKRYTHTHTNKLPHLMLYSGHVYMYMYMAFKAVYGNIFRRYMYILHSVHNDVLGGH